MVHIMVVLKRYNVPPLLCAMNDGNEANLDIFFGYEETSRLYFCSEDCRQRYGLIGVSKLAMAEVETRKLGENRLEQEKE